MTFRARCAIFFVTIVLSVAITASAQDAAHEAWVAGDVATAERLYRERLAASPDDTQALHRLGLIQSWAGKNEEALVFFDRLVQLRPDDAEAQVDRARALAWHGDPRAAAQALKPVIEKNPTDLTVLRAAAEFLSWSNDLKGSADAYSRILQIAPDDRRVALQRARVLSWDQQHDAAEKAFKDLLQKSPEDRDALLGLAQLYAWSGRHEDAEQTYNRILALDPSNVAALRGLAQTASWSGRLSEGETRWRALLAQTPDDPAALVGLSSTLRWQGRDAAAMQAAERAVSLAPTDPEARTALEWASLASRSRVAPTVTFESDTDENDLTTFGISTSLRSGFTSDVRLDLYQRSAENLDSYSDAAITRGALLGYGRQFDPGWRFFAGGGIVRNEETDENRPLIRASLSSPSRFPMMVALNYQKAPFDYTAQLIHRDVEIEDLSLTASFTPSPGWLISAGGGVADFFGNVSNESNRRTSAQLSLSRRFARYFTVGAAGRAFEFDKDLNDGYFDPNRYTLSELFLRYAREWNRWGVNLEAAPGIQRVGRNGDDTTTARAAAALTWSLFPGRSISLNAGYSDAAVGQYSESTGEGYRYFSLGLGVNFAF